MLTILVKPSSGKCNLKCKYCFYADETDNRAIPDYGFMSEKVADKLIERAFETDDREILFAFQGGEPMLIGLPFYEHFVKRVKNRRGNKKVYYTIQTNGTLIDDAYAKFFRKNDFLVGVSLDGDEQTHNRNRIDHGGNGSFDKVMQNIKRLEKTRVDFNIVAVVDKKSCREIKKTYRFFKDNGFRYLQFIPCVDTIDGDSRFMMSEREAFEYMSELFDLWYDDILKNNYVSIRNFDNYVGILQGRAPENCSMCGVCGNYFTVEADGSVFPCDFYCVDEWLLGNIDDAPFGMLGTDVIEKFIGESFVKNKKCERCRYFFICRNGCKKDRVGGLNRYCESFGKFFAAKEKQLTFLTRNLK